MKNNTSKHHHRNPHPNQIKVMQRQIVKKKKDKKEDAKRSFQR
jgi:hypothetical protein